MPVEQFSETNYQINSAVVIPAFNPEAVLVGLVRKLLRRGVPQVIVVNDGSGCKYDAIFTSLEKIKRCTVITHERNRGKGRALKSAFHFFLAHCAKLGGVVTADADGQHTAEDIIHLAKMLTQQGEVRALLLGVRNFRVGNVPKRSFIGNLVTSRIFWLLYGDYLPDTQTGLRAIPTGELGWIAQVEGEYYDYEINMLIQARFHHLELSLIPIKTLYFNNNAGSHYHTIRDSVRIFLCLLSGLIRYAKTIVLSGVLDLAIFFGLYSYFFAFFMAPVRIFWATFVARLCSSACNYALNRRMIFADSRRPILSVVRYYLLWLALLLSSYGLVYSVSLIWRAVNVTFIKIAVDFVLGLLSYQFQLRWVFRDRKSKRVIFPPGVKNEKRSI